MNFGEVDQIILDCTRDEQFYVPLNSTDLLSMISEKNQESKSSSSRLEPIIQGDKDKDNIVLRKSKFIGKNVIFLNGSPQQLTKQKHASLVEL